jgi:hypothetical protein
MGETVRRLGQDLGEMRSRRLGQRLKNEYIEVQNDVVLHFYI